MELKDVDLNGIITVGSGLIGLVANAFLGYKKTGKLSLESLLGILTWFMEKYKPKLENQNHYNIVEPVIETSKIEEKEKEVILKKEPKNVITVQFSHPKENFRVTSPFGMRVLTINGKKQESFHNGTDFGGSGDCEAAEDCIIEKIVLPDNEYPCVFKYTSQGWVYANVPTGRAWTPYISVIGIHTKNRYCYKHVKTSKEIKVGQSLQVGEVFCIADNLGYSQGAHLHFELQEFKNGKYGDFINPEKFLESKGIVLKR